MESSTSASVPAASSTATACFNSNCKKPLEQPRRGWRRRSGGFAELCDRCASAYEEAKFCETFHMNNSGWRCCETCGKQIHCGCIGSFHLFVLLDAGGIECISCTRKSFILTPNPAWPPPPLFLPLQPERIKDLSSKDWSAIAGSGPVSWRHAPSLFNGTSAKSELQAKSSPGIDVSGGSDRQSLSASHEKKINEDLCRVSTIRPVLNETPSSPLVEGKLKEDAYEILTNGSLKLFENGDGGFIHDNQTIARVSGPPKTYFQKSDSSIPNTNMITSSRIEMNNQSKTPLTSTRAPVPSPSIGKKTCNGLAMYGETHLRSVKGRGDARARNHLLPRYWPRITDEELQQISGDSNSIITPLFEKILSASDAGRIGRLVLPKKCAETYLPPISQPEGLPLKIQDVKGNEWVFQFRFWPNNNSRMYVLEGVTPCIQSLQLQAGDIVIFSRIEPEGKLVMGGRKASVVPSSDQGNGDFSNGEGVSRNAHITIERTKLDEVDPASTRTEIKKSGQLVKEMAEAKNSVRVKRKNSTLAPRSKRLRIENEDMIELKLTWEQAQGLFRPPPNCAPKSLVIEGCEFEEYEDGPIIGRPTIPANDDLRGKIQWIQCEDCLKWRKIPASILLPSRWTCYANSFDSERSVCSAAQEHTTEQLQGLLPTVSKGAFKKKRTAKQDPGLVETLEGLDTLANLAIREEGASSRATTRHPRHKPGCSCIVCMQPPSGQGSKHKQPCDCIVCQSVKRRFRRTMTKKHEKQQVEEDAETALQNLQRDANTNLSVEVGITFPSREVVHETLADDSNERALSPSPLEGKIDLNIQPEREEEPSPGTGPMSILPFLQDATERHLSQQKHSCSDSGAV